MSYKYIKNELKSYTQFKKELKFLNDELEMLKKENSNVKSYCPGEKVQISETKDPTFEMVLDNMEKEKILECEISKKRLKINRIERIIDILPELERDLVKCRYFYNMSWAAISMRFGYCERYLQKKLNIALEDLNEVYQDITRIHNELTVEI